MPPTTFRIAIIGAGPGGLLCARVLQRYGVPVTVFERQLGPVGSAPGGPLELRPASGQAALRAAGLEKEFRAAARPAGQEVRLLDRTGAVLDQDVPAPGPAAERPEIGRHELRRLLADALAPGTVRWGRYLRTLHPRGGGRHQAVFDDGETATFDLVVGADGTWSRVRPQLSEAVPHYSGVTFVETGLHDVDTRHPALARLVGRGTMMALSGPRGLLARRDGRGRIRVYAAFRCSEDWAREAGVNTADTEAVRAALLAAFDGWHDGLRALLRDSDDGFATRPLFALPVPHTWPHTPGLTLLGDAAHLMTPLTGPGADLALRDGCELARHLAEAHTWQTDPDQAVRAYEAALFPRSAAAAAAAAHDLDTALAPEAPRSAHHLPRRRHPHPS
ncbi:MULTISPECIES: NAD(P)/FAD-dependent oxidoreductase [unclassified Streptomyces]|uniref:FAD-dependent oxidoreductase n=1 Tax=unclassified Streptomyces TaxID=2593676 RepID=UPI0003732C73|nr:MULTISPECIES: NAD(P)/FAD-dependent oxidoreductase [unclassified Streptomyces]MYT28866.1 NAD(P)-binding protein [Streptomyces sp. SID8354]